MLIPKLNIQSVGGVDVRLRVPTPSGIDQTVQGILTAADPMQELIDAMQFGTKPNYMFGGDEAVGSTEIGGSGFDMADSGTPAKQQPATIAELGGGDFTIIDSVTDSMRNTSDGALQPGTGSFAFLWVAGITALSGTRNLMGDYDFATVGYYLFGTGAGRATLSVIDGTGTTSAFVDAGLVAGEGHCIMGTINQTSNDVDVHCQAGTMNSTGGLAGTTLSATTQTTVIAGDLASGHTIINLEHGITAYWKGAAAEALTKTHNDNLIAWLGY